MGHDTFIWCDTSLPIVGCCGLYVFRLMTCTLVVQIDMVSSVSVFLQCFEFLPTTKYTKPSPEDISLSGLLYSLEEYWWWSTVVYLANCMQQGGASSWGVCPPRHLLSVWQTGWFLLAFCVPEGTEEHVDGQAVSALLSSSPVSTHFMNLGGHLKQAYKDVHLLVPVPSGPGTGTSDGTQLAQL